MEGHPDEGRAEQGGFPPKVWRRTNCSNSFRVLQEDEEDEEEIAQVFSVEGQEEKPRWEIQESPTAKEATRFVRAVKDAGIVSLGRGDIIVDSAADESCWPVGQGDAYKTRQTAKELKLRTASGGDMKHYGEKLITFKYKGGEAKDPVGLKFQVTDVKKPLLAVRRLVEKGNVVMLSNVEGESYIYNKEAKMKIPVVKKGGSFVIEAEFVQGFIGRA